MQSKRGVWVGSAVALSILPFLLMPKGRSSTPIVLSAIAISLGIAGGSKHGLPSTGPRRFRLVLALVLLFALLWLAMGGLHGWQRDSRNLQGFAALLLLAFALLAQSRFARWLEAPQAPMHSIRDVVQLELEWIHARRQAVGIPADPPSPMGLALSGGGLRSAAVSLGFLRECFDRRTLGFFDYLTLCSCLTEGTTTTWGSRRYVRGPVLW